MKNLLLIATVVLSQALYGQSKEIVEFMESLNLVNVYIEYVDTYEESDALAIVSNIDLPIVLDGIKPFRKERSRLVKFYHYKYEEYNIVYAKWRDGSTTLGVYKGLEMKQFVSIWG